MDKYKRKNKKNWHGYKGFGGISGKLWSDIKYTAKRRNIKFNLTIEQAWNKFISQNKICALSGKKLRFNRSEKTFAKGRTASLDRKNSKGNYNVNNIQWIDKKINVMKQSMSDKQFVDICSKICYYNKARKKYNL